jgi:beta-D-xylosidase 4
MMLSALQVAATLTLLKGLALAAAPYEQPDCTKEPLRSNGICDIGASPAERAAALVAALTPREKVNNLVR